MSKKARSIEDIPTVFLVCRALNHPWRDASIVDKITVKSKAGVILEIQRTTQCGRCETDRVMTIEFRSFDITASTYLYPDLYLVDGTGGVPITKSEARKELFARGHWRAR